MSLRSSCFWRRLREEVLEVDWSSWSAGRSAFWEHVQNFWKSKFARGVVEIPANLLNAFQEEIEKELSEAVNKWGQVVQIARFT